MYSWEENDSYPIGDKLSELVNGTNQVIGQICFDVEYKRLLIRKWIEDKKNLPCADKRPISGSYHCG